MPASSTSFLKPLGLAALGLLLAAVSAAAIWSRYFEKKGGPEASDEALKAVKLIGKDTLELKPETVKVLGLQIAPVQAANQPRPLHLSGSLGMDTNYLARVHTRFAGEIMEIGQIQVQEPDEKGELRTRYRPLDYQDKVKGPNKATGEPGDLLAVVWSKDLGEKKSELVGAIAQQRLHEDTLKRLERYSGSVPERTIREAQLAVEADTIAVERARRTLRSWLLTEREIKEIEQEAERIWENKGKRTPLAEKDWARVEIRAPFDGTILERNIAPRDIVDTSADLFKVADLRHLRVWANVYEEDLPALQKRGTPIPWKVRLKADPTVEIDGRAEKIGDIVDPNDHTARVMGVVNNKEGRLKAGQFVTATIDLKADEGEVQIPAGALVEDGSESVVFVQPEEGQGTYTQRHVKVTRRTRDVVFVRGVIFWPGWTQKTPRLAVGERVVTSGAVELKAKVDELAAAN